MKHGSIQNIGPGSDHEVAVALTSTDSETSRVSKRLSDEDLSRLHLDLFTISMPAEVFVRLVNGRADSQHARSVESSGNVTFDQLSSIFRFRGL